MLELWEVKHGLDEIQRRLDDGMFSEEQRRYARAWLRGRRIARCLPALVGLAAFAASLATIYSAIK
jgi:hypothetical protein